MTENDHLRLGFEITLKIQSCFAVAQSVKRASFKGPGSRCNSTTDVGLNHAVA